MRRLTQLFLVTCLFAAALPGYAQKQKPTYIPVDVGMFGLANSGSITVDGGIAPPVTVANLDFYDTEFAMQDLKIDAAASLGLNSIALNLSGSADYTTVVADYARFRTVPVKITIQGDSNAIGAVAHVGVCCRLQFITTDAAITLGLQQAKLGVSVSFSYLSESLRLGAYGFQGFTPFSLSTDSNGVINTGDLKKSLVTAFNALMAQNGSYKPKLIGIELAGADGNRLDQALRDNKKIEIALP
ncbi:MAG TPA: hypothetical protein VHE55_07990 [Fimbriimonadaceae bacterium]|nr:hypothetical protein [Fimbriimonadaceae bacterium]